MVEYGMSEWTVSAVANQFALPTATLAARLTDAGSRVQRLLRNRKPRIEVARDSVRVEAFAGILRIAGGLELEIAPKFLGADADSWREDFFCVATLTHFGRLLPAEALLADRGRRGDLATLAARALAEMFWENHRRPLRVYRTISHTEFSADGDVAPESFLMPSMDGFEGSSLSLVKDNAFNATIQQAARVLLTEVLDADARKQLERIVVWLGNQSNVRDIGRRRILPSRARRWQGLYDLCCEILDGFGVRFGENESIAPGFLIDTWRAWQDLVTIGVRIGLHGAAVHAQREYQLGSREMAGDQRTATVVPDLVIDSTLRVIVDAKYKGRFEDSRDSVSEADLYEALAFLEAAPANDAVLFYPAIPVVGVSPMPPGTCRQFETIVVGRRCVVGVEVEVRGISKTRGLATFSANIGEWLRRNYAI
jgi:hypothetical protein